MAGRVSTVGRAVVAGSPHGVGNKNLTHIYLWLKILY